MVNSTKTANVRNNKYIVEVAGKGAPCLAIGNGLLAQRTLSLKFKESFEVFASDLYWGYNQRLKNRSSLTFDRIIEDIVELKNALKLEKPVIFGFSAFGIIALELVKRHPDLASAVIMVGTPLNSNQNVANTNQKIFEETADEQRKQIDSYRRDLVSKEDLSILTFQERFKREYIYRDAPRYWHNPEFDCSEIWEGIELDQILDHFFGNIMPFIDVTKDIEKIKTPTYLAAGLSDFNCCPAQAWGALKKSPKNFFMETYSQSGHYPQFEEQELFDTRIVSWYNKHVV